MKLLLVVCLLIPSHLYAITTTSTASEYRKAAEMWKKVAEYEFEEIKRERGVSEDLRQELESRPEKCTHTSPVLVAIFGLAVGFTAATILLEVGGAH